MMGGQDARALDYFVRRTYFDCKREKPGIKTGLFRVIAPLQIKSL
jgi:hypothetical protein